MGRRSSGLLGSVMDGIDLLAGAVEVGLERAAQEREHQRRLANSIEVQYRVVVTTPELTPSQSN